MKRSRIPIEIWYENLPATFLLKKKDYEQTNE